MTKAEEIANWLLTGEVEQIDLFEAAELIRQQAEQINNLLQWQRRQLDVIEAQKVLIKEQDKKIIDLAFKLVYAERSNEIVLEANTRSRP